MEARKPPVEPVRSTLERFNAFFIVVPASLRSSWSQVLALFMRKLVIFDMDGLLLDSERPIRDAWLAEAKRHGHPMDQATYSEVIGRNDRDTREIFRKHFGNDFPFDQICLRVQDILKQSVEQSGYKPKSGAIELLDYLASRSVECVIATSTEKSEACARLLKAKILSYVREVTGGDEVSHGKPEPDLFLLAAKKQGVAPRDCLVLEDSAPGARAAHAAGMQVIVVPDLKEPPQDVRGFSLGIFPSLRESRPTVERWLA